MSDIVFALFNAFALKAFFYFWNKHTAIKKVTNDWTKFEGMLEYLDDKDVLKAAIDNNVITVIWASGRLQKDLEIIKYCIAKDWHIIQIMPEWVQNDINIAFFAVQNNGKALEYLPPIFQDNEIIVQAAIKIYDKALIFASPRLQKKFEMKPFILHDCFRR